MNTNGNMRINVPKIVHEVIDGETIILNLDNGNYFSLDGTGADIWGLIDSGVSVNGVIERLQNVYKADHEVIKDAVHRFVAEMLQEGLIVHNETGHSAGPGAGDAKTGPGITADKPDFHVPALNKYNDMQDLLLLDPIHDVDEAGWPTAKQDQSSKKK